MDVVVIGGGQAGLAAAFYLRRAGLEYVVLDDAPEPGGAWTHTWESLRLFSPAEFSSLPGWQMPPSRGGNPDAAHVVDYLRRYEERYEIPVERPVHVTEVRQAAGGFVVVGVDGAHETRTWRAPVVVSATGTWSRPFVPAIDGRSTFLGRQLHCSRYVSPAAHEGRRVMVVGGANSGAQIAADLALDPAVPEILWCTLDEPRYLPDDVDGRELFRLASARVRGEEGARGVGGLGDIVVVPPVREARDTGALRRLPMPQRLTRTGAVWADGTTREFDDLVWCTGFRPALRHLDGLDLPRESGHVVTDGPRVEGVPGLYLVGYGDWAGPASATLIGVGQWARAAVDDACALLGRGTVRRR
ncbi:ArsO family NAD(P)H-dependent flavin-containing monooxygenase [Mobilicoccus pelagius]|uniref:Putative FAD-dependent oxidoreductase n=1 Tax=Mobilicoccus pelagius NBRC 104925 TaxID=1089455 RepID=H5UMH1_9MICO|nr:ArsO family NAD(P)H-dependent flavin-containing monooxygenase [Mobilicoccus pelagius]GAB46929.1 putative FAD-dependent oxidoreductase [Mobilicoccus pelagius NBRC 104925]